MPTIPYVFKRDGSPVAVLAVDGKFTSNHDGGGWEEYANAAEFLIETGVEMDPVNYLMQLGAAVGGYPELDMAAYSQQVAATAEPVTPALTTEPPKRGRKKATAPTDAPPSTPPPPPTPSGITDPAVLAFIASQKTAMASQPPVSAVPVEAVPVAPPVTPPATNHTVPPLTPVPPRVQVSNDGQQTLGKLVETYGLAEVLSNLHKCTMQHAGTVAALGFRNAAENLQCVAANLEKAIPFARAL